MREEIDIVDRLSISWTSMTEMGNSERSEAAKEIWRLRGDLGELAQKILELTVERDEARRMFCNAMASNSRLGFTTPRSFAEDEGWDCYKENTQ
jgi:hypothetical protein